MVGYFDRRLRGAFSPSISVRKVCGVSLAVARSIIVLRCDLSSTAFMGSA